MALADFIFIIHNPQSLRRFSKWGGLRPALFDASQHYEIVGILG
jgi:hypothetical protein